MSRPPALGAPDGMTDEARTHMLRQRMVRALGESVHSIPGLPNRVEMGPVQIASGKREAREGHHGSKDAQNLTGLRAKLHRKKRHAEKIQMKKPSRRRRNECQGRRTRRAISTPLPHYLLDRSKATNAKALSSAIKDKRN